MVFELDGSHSSSIIIAPTVLIRSPLKPINPNRSQHLRALPDNQGFPTMYVRFHNRQTSSYCVSPAGSLFIGAVLTTKKTLLKFQHDICLGAESEKQTGVLTAALRRQDHHLLHNTQP